MTTLARFAARLATLLGFLFLIPGVIGVLLLLAASQITSFLVGQEHAAHADALYPADLAPESEPR